jgi:hypothetical protein
LSNLRLTVISLSGRRLIITSTGYVGLAPEATQLGDVIAVLIRCSFLVVLRPHSKFYKVAGECYVHGLMNGEVLGLERAGDALSDCLCSVRLVGYSPGFNDIPFLNFKNVSGHVVME